MTEQKLGTDELILLRPRMNTAIYAEPKEFTMSIMETVVITGASGGLGRAIARKFGRRKAQVVLLARGREGLNGAAAEVNAEGGKA